MNKCPYCNTSYSEIVQTGFVGCQRCYQEIDELKKTVHIRYGEKKHKGKTLGGEDGRI